MVLALALVMGCSFRERSVVGVGDGEGDGEDGEDHEEDGEVGHGRHGGFVPFENWLAFFP